MRPGDDNDLMTCLSQVWAREGAVGGKRNRRSGVGWPGSSEPSGEGQCPQTPTSTSLVGAPGAGGGGSICKDVAAIPTTPTSEEAGARALPVSGSWRGFEALLLMIKTSSGEARQSMAQGV